jgi:hypothetical protein
MKDERTAIRQTCHCGHDICNHHDKAFDCLVLGCTCKAYVNQNEEKTPDTLRGLPAAPKRARSQPHASPSCYCAACRRWYLERYA